MYLSRALSQGAVRLFGVSHHEPHKVIKILEPLLPAAQVQVLSAALRAAQLDSMYEPESKPAEELSEVSISHPSPAPDKHIPLLASSSQNELSVARILQSTVSMCPIPLLLRM